MRAKNLKSKRLLKREQRDVNEMKAEKYNFRQTKSISFISHNLRLPK